MSSGLQQRLYHYALQQLPVFHTLTKIKQKDV